MTDDEQLAVGGQSSAKPITDFSQAVQVRAFAYPSTLFPSLVVFLSYVQKTTREEESTTLPQAHQRRAKILCV
jgi:hypothetical protein